MIACFFCFLWCFQRKNQPPKKTPKSFGNLWNEMREIDFHSCLKGCFFTTSSCECRTISVIQISMYPWTLFWRPRIWKESDETLGELSAKQLLVEVWEFVAVVFVSYRKVLRCWFWIVFLVFLPRSRSMQHHARSSASAFGRQNFLKSGSHHVELLKL